MKDIKCKICGEVSHEIFTAIVLHKYNIKYFKCSNCSFIETEEPYWIGEAYNDYISIYDVWSISRPLQNSQITTNLINKIFDNKKFFLDYGGGSGIFTRMMRDIGFNFLYYDRYTKNLHAQCFEIENFPEIEKFELITCFEVFEHLSDPLSEIENMLKYSDSIFLSTNLIPYEINSIDDWPYFAPEHGQHISFYDLKTLNWIANRYNLNLYSNNFSYHLLSKKTLKANNFAKIVSNNPLSLFDRVLSFINRKFTNRIYSVTSLTEKDSNYVKNKLLLSK